MIGSEKTSKRQGITLILFLLLFVFLLGCELVENIHSLFYNQRYTRVNGYALTEQTRAATTSQVEVNKSPEPNSATEYAWEMGGRCIDASGNDPCPMEACIPASDQYNAVLEKTVELFGKANPDNYSCGADYTFTNNSGADLLVWHNILGHEGDLVTVSAIKIAKDDILFEYHYNYFDRHDGIVTFRKIPKIYVIYDNPHCQWIAYGDAELEQLSVDLMNPCGD